MMRARRMLAVLTCGLMMACGQPDMPMPDVDLGPEADAQVDLGDPVLLDFVDLELPEEPVELTALAFVPGRDELLVAEKAGGIVHYHLEDDELTFLGRVELPDVDPVQECGLVDLVFDPNWATNDFLFAVHCLDGRASRVVRLEFDGELGDEVVDSLVEIYRVDRGFDLEESNHQHTMTTIGFEPSGAMFVSVGERRHPDGAQETDNDLGALVRIVPSRTPGGGSIPASGNAFGPDEGSENIFAYGLRSPWKAVLDSQGRYWVGDVGGSRREEVNLITAAGQNFGWPEHEGRCDCARFDDPVIDYARTPSHRYVRDDPEGAAVRFRSVYVGIEYQPTAMDRYGGWLTGRMIFGDALAGFVRVAQVDEDGRVTEDRHVGHMVIPTDWAQGPDGYIYATALGDTRFTLPSRPPGRLVRAVPRAAED